MNTRTTYKPSNLDMFFMSVSAVTVSSMTTVEMEVFSNAQLIVISFLILVGGEVFTSMVGFKLAKYKHMSSDSNVEPISFLDRTKLGYANTSLELENDISEKADDLKNGSIRNLGNFVLSYLLVTNISGSALVAMYLNYVPSASAILKNKGINLGTFSVFMAISSFANCGSTPTNESLILFRNNSGLLLLLIPQILFGNTLYASCLRFVIWFLSKFTNKPELDYMLKNVKEMEYKHFLPSLNCKLLVVTAFGFILVQFILFCSLEWSSEVLDGSNSFEKIVAVLFQTVNSRHAGECIVDIATLSSAVLVLFAMMMYLPPYTSFMPIKDNVESLSYNKKSKKGGLLVENILFSQLGYLVIFIIVICITEHKEMKEDPVNFSLLNIVVEVMSAYGNTGFTTGYSCSRRINADGFCKDAWYGFVGRWSNKGKIVLILVMLFGRLKKFNLNKRRAWTLS